MREIEKAKRAWFMGLSADEGEAEAILACQKLELSVSKQLDALVHEMDPKGAADFRAALKRLHASIERSSARLATRLAAAG